MERKHRVFEGSSGLKLGIASRINAPRYFLSHPESLHLLLSGPLFWGSGSQVSSSSAACAGLKPASAWYARSCEQFF